MKFPVWRRRREEDLKEEIDNHLKMAKRDRTERGESAEHAEIAGRRELGNEGLVREVTRSMWGLRSLEILFQDIRYGMRMLVRHPGFTAVAVLSLALGIGANTAIFSVVNVLLFKPLPYPEPHKLMALVQPDYSPGAKGDYAFWSYPAYESFRDHSNSFQNVAAYSSLTAIMTVDDQPDRETGEIVTASYFQTLGVNAGLGRVILPEEDQTLGMNPVVVLGHDLWRKRLAGDPKVIGKTIYLNKAPYTVIGVMPVGFRGQAGKADFWTPMMMADQLRYVDILKMPGSVWLKIIGRLKPEISIDRARAELPILAGKVIAAAPIELFNDKGRGEFRLVPLKDTKVDPAVQRAFLILLASVICVLLIACANTANLLLARAVWRQKEFAVRAALGAGRTRLIRQVLTESVMLSLIGGVVGLLIGLLGINWLTTAKPWNSTGPYVQYALTFQYFSVELDWRVLAFNFAVALITGIVFGLAPALQSGRSDVNGVLKRGSNGSTTGFGSLRRISLRGALVTLEVAISLVLLTGAGLMIKSMTQLTAVKTGFDPNNVVAMVIGNRDVTKDFYQTLLEKVEFLPGVKSASFSQVAPLSVTNGVSDVEIENRPSSGASKRPAEINVITRGFLATFHITLVKGRNFDEHDTESSSHVGLINRTMADRFWPGEDPIGKRFKSPYRFAHETGDQWTNVVGVVDDVKYVSVETEVEPAYYLPAVQSAMGTGTLSVRTDSDPLTMIAAIRQQVSALDKTVAVYGITTMDDRVAEATSRYRYSAVLMALFAGLALVLAAVGIYGVVNYVVSARTKELGIRLALGARPAEIIKLVMMDASALILIGVVVGGVGSVMTTRVLTSQLYQVRPTDPMTFASTIVVLAVAALLACYLPARRASKVDPMAALRCE